MATSGMEKFGLRGVWGIVKYNMADSTEQRKVLNKRNVMVASKAAIGSHSGVPWEWSGSVMMIGGGGSNCSEAGHGIGVTSAKLSSFKIQSGSRPEWDFSNFHWNVGIQKYALNVWMR